MFHRRRPVPIILLLLLFILSCKQTTKPGDTKDDTAKSITSADAVEEAKLNDLTGPHSIKQILSQSWENREDLDDSRTMVGNSDMDIVSRGYVFFEDGSMIKNIRGDLRPGSWKLEEEKKPVTISVSFTDGNKEKLYIAVLKPFALTLNEGVGSDKKLVEYSAPALSYKDKLDDPFYISNNKWRIKPGKPETDAAIKERVRQCIHFYILYYNYNLASKADKVNFTGLPSCFRWYAGGILLYKERDLPQKWIHCFYDNTQAMKAYELAGKIVSKKYQWPKGEKNWLKQNVFVLRQMEEAISSVDLPPKL